MQSFDRELQSLIFPGNKVADQNKSDNCEEYEQLNQTVAETSLIRLVIGDIACQKEYNVVVCTVGPLISTKIGFRRSMISVIDCRLQADFHKQAKI